MKMVLAKKIDWWKIGDKRKRRQCSINHPLLFCVAIQEIKLLLSQSGEEEVRPGGKKMTSESGSFVRMNVFAFRNLQRFYTASLQGFAPNYATYSWLVDGYSSQNNVEALLSISDDIGKRGIYVDKSLYRALIRRLCMRGMVNVAHEIYNKMLGKGLLGDSLVYSSLAYGYLSAGKRIKACEILNEMVEKQLNITAKVYKCLCASYVNESVVLDLLWSHAIERGLIAKNVYKLMQEAIPNSQKDALNVPSSF
ncbi:hypothetical protein ZIOFF_071352 [Zingiber officinale]|uniref:Pentatricopeptide repeat-containing protein n=1 Tax=Zingiber officinale TaxID=94328 RepID=A0A8J5C9K0_ZINOF|nr:hypothetical protein ZIOFF_071352 [Zingiber officinale]